MSCAPRHNDDPAARRPRQGLSITLRLTAWSAAMILAVHAASAGVLYVGLLRMLHAEVDAVLDGEWQELAARVHRHPGDLRAAEADIREELGRRTRRDIRFRLISPDGRELLDSDADPHGGFPDPPVGPAAEAAFDADGFLTVASVGGVPAMRVHRRRVELANGRWAWGEATYSLEQVGENLRHLMLLWLATLPAVGVLAAAGGWVIARRSLRPVADMTAAARAVQADVSGGRLAVRGTGDELDRLAATINAMLDRIAGHVGRMQRFTADASHELRTPLAALRGAAEVALSRGRSAEELREALEAAVEQYDRLARIAEDLLLLARADAGADVLRRGPVDARGLLADAADLYAAVAESRGVRLTVADCPAVTLDGDGGRLLQLLGNLLDNALRHTPAGGEVTLSATAEGEAATLTVRDTGRGIPAEHLSRVFDRFHRADPGRDRASGGAGLGLSICRAIAEMHGGGIDLSSETGKGTTVRVRLPSARPAK
jgi:heavy metal sensor kinase